MGGRAHCGLGARTKAGRVWHVGLASWLGSVGIGSKPSQVVRVCSCCRLCHMPLSPFPRSTVLRGNTGRRFLLVGMSPRPLDAMSVPYYADVYCLTHAMRSNGKFTGGALCACAILVHQPTHTRPCPGAPWHLWKNAGKYGYTLTLSKGVKPQCYR